MSKFETKRNTVNVFRENDIKHIINIANIPVNIKQNCEKEKRKCK